MYYFVPKQAERPVYSYSLSVVHFWALIFTYMWVGPHHLHYTALPDWTQSVGMVFSVILFVPSWGGMINGIRSEEHTSELQSLMRISYAVFCLKKKQSNRTYHDYTILN